MKTAFIAMVAALLLNPTPVLADGDVAHFEFPEWTYWIEIVEHAAIVLIAMGAIFYILTLHKSDREIKNANVMIFGLVLLALSQLLTSLHHFLIYPFGEWNAIVHHGLLLISIIVVIYAYINLIQKKGFGVKK